MDSKFRLVGVGIATKDKEEDSYILEVHPVEHYPTLEGDYNLPDVLVANNQDIHGEFSTTAGMRSKTITCKWLNMYNSNRMSAPDVVIGEMVYIWQFGGSDEYYWTSYTLNMRKKEKVLYTYSNKTESLVNEKDTGDQMYYFLVDTKNKELVLHTANNDGEQTTYDVVMATDRGTTTFEDMQGNYMHLESVKNEGTLTQNVNDKIQTHTKHSILESDETITSKTKIESRNSESLTVNNKNDYVINTGKYRVEVGGDELLKLIRDLTQVCIDCKNWGNLGIMTVVTETSVAQFQAIQSRLDAMLAGGNKDVGTAFEPPEVVENE